MEGNAQLAAVADKNAANNTEKVDELIQEAGIKPDEEIKKAKDYLRGLLAGTC